MNEEEWNSYEAALKHERDARAIEEQKLMDAEAKGLAEGKAEGLAEGLVAGEKAAKIEIARGMLAKKMDIKLIIELTGLSENQINGLNVKK